MRICGAHHASLSYNNYFVSIKNKKAEITDFLCKPFFLCSNRILGFVVNIVRRNVEKKNTLVGLGV